MIKNMKNVTLKDLKDLKKLTILNKLNKVSEDMVDYEKIIETLVYIKQVYNESFQWNVFDEEDYKTIIKNQKQMLKLNLELEFKFNNNYYKR